MRFSLSLFRKYLFFSLVIAGAYFIIPSSVHAVVFESGIPGVGPGGAQGAPLPENIYLYVSYLYVFLLGAVGIAAFISLVVWGTVWVASGIVDKKALALESIKNTFIGVFIALTSYVILYTINPDLTILKQPSTPAPGGTTGVTTSTVFCVSSLSCKTNQSCVNNKCTDIAVTCGGFKTSSDCTNNGCAWCAPINSYTESCFSDYNGCASSN